MNDPQHLIDAYIDGVLDDAGFAALCDWLRADASHRRTFARALALHAGMAEWSSDQTGDVLMPELTELSLSEESGNDGSDWLDALAELDASGVAVSPVDLTAELARREDETRRDVARRRADAAKHSHRTLTIPPAIAWVGIAAAIGLVIWIAWPAPPAKTQTPSVRLDHGDANTLQHYAVLRDSIDIRWAAHSPRQLPHTSMSQETYELLSGMARVEMANGTSLVIEGPARLRIVGPDRLHLETGRLTAQVPPHASSFTVSTPTALVVEHGKSFGVESTPSLGTLVQAFEGYLDITPTAQDQAHAATARTVHANHAAQISPTGVHVTAVPPSQDRFVRHETFEALSGSVGDQAHAEALRLMWRRDPALFAAHAFDPALTKLKIGWLGEMVVARGAYSHHTDSLPHPAGGSVMGGRIRFLPTPDHASIFLRLDTRPGSQADQSGVLAPGSGMVGRDGTRVCIAWTMRLERTGQPEDGWCGLSLFSGDEDRDTSEIVFFGKINGSRTWGVEVHRDTPGQAALQETRRFSSPEPLEPGRVYQWLVVIDFEPGNDRVSIYLDPDPEQLAEPFAVMTQTAIEFDRLRLESAKNNCIWSFDDLRLGTQARTVLSN
ncbi:hypothetical protein OT109_16240 [Phycisphaeraceae bacterium D3-23]